MTSESPSRSPISLLTIASEPLLAIGLLSLMRGHIGDNPRAMPAGHDGLHRRCEICLFLGRPRQLDHVVEALACGFIVELWYERRVGALGLGEMRQRRQQHHQ